MFIPPTDAEVLDAFGAEPTSADGEPTVRVVRISFSAQDDFVLSYDVIVGSVRFLWFRGSRKVVELFREDAVSLTVYSGGGSAGFRVGFETDGLAGVLAVVLHPEVDIVDTLLRTR